MKKLFLWLAAFLLLATNANATLVGLTEGSFTPAASTITFSEYATNTKNPVYTYTDYTVSFGSYFVGGMGTPTTGSDLAIDYTADETFITGDGANPTSPVLSGYPRFEGSVAVLFSDNVAAVGLDGGYFDAIGGTTIVAYDRQGNTLGSITNSELGIEFFGLGDSSGDAVIAGIQFYITGNEPAGYAIDNVTFAFDLSGYTPTPVPSTIALLGFGLAGIIGIKRKKEFIK